MHVQPCASTSSLGWKIERKVAGGVGGVRVSFCASDDPFPVQFYSQEVDLGSFRTPIYDPMRLLELETGMAVLQEHSTNQPYRGIPKSKGILQGKVSTQK